MGYDIVLSAQPEQDREASSVPLSAQRLAQWGRIEAELRGSLPGPVQSNSDDAIAQLHFAEIGLIVNVFAEYALVMFHPPGRQESATLHSTFARRSRRCLAARAGLPGTRRPGPRSTV